MPINPNAAELGKLRRRWFQFRLRTLLIAVTLLAIPCGFVGEQKAIVARRAVERHLLEQSDAVFFEDGVFGMSTPSGDRHGCENCLATDPFKSSG